ncbi:MAG: hypothetical protein AAGH19_10725 [Pseudomonadota bacterium]
MILTRFRQSLQNQNWSGAFMDLVIVVAGILLALAVDQWMAERRERAEEREILIGLQRDIAASEDRVDEALAGIDLMLEGLKLIAAGPEGPMGIMEATTLDLHFANGLWEVIPYTTEMNTYAELVNSGKLGVIDDAEIRRALASYERSFQLSQRLFDDVFQNQQLKLDRFLLNALQMPQLLTAQASQRTDRDYDLVNTLPPQRHVELLPDPALQNQVAAKASLVSEYRQHVVDVRSALEDLGVMVVARSEYLAR